MKEKSFKPMLAPNEKVDLSTLNYSLLASTKLDGIRCIFKDGEILSRSLKQIQCKQLRERLEPIRKFSEDNNIIFDGEIYSDKLTFQEITHFVMTQDLGDEELPASVKFYCFDSIEDNKIDTPFKQRAEFATLCMMRFPDIAFPVAQVEVDNAEEVNNFFEQVLKENYEGLILRGPKGAYKYGRGTLKEGLIFKVKPFLDFDGQIIDVIQATEVNEDAEKKINELGRSVTSKKKNERHTIEKASAFMVKYEGKDLKVVLSMTDEEKEEVWENKENYIGRWISYKGMLVGSKDVPRHPVMIRFREPK
jgi:DNA ligase-1